jgi:hypothetical protein
MSRPRAFAPYLAAVVLFLHAGAASPQTATAESDAPSYKPPARGAPKQTVGGGTRSIGVPPVVSVLAPDHTGFTSQAQPTLYWHLSKPTAGKIEIAVMDAAAGSRPIATRVLSGVEAAGIQAVSLRDLKMKLAPGVDYRWSVALVPAEGSERVPVLASGAVRFVPAPESLTARLVQGDDAGRAAVYAAEGYWYDAVHALVEGLRSGPDTGRARTHLAALLKQGGVRSAIAE